MHYPAVPGRYCVAFFASALILAVVVRAPLLPREQGAAAEGPTFEGSYLQLRATATHDNPDTREVEGALAGVTFSVSFSGGTPMTATTNSNGVLTLPESAPLPSGNRMTVNFVSAPEGYSLDPEVEFPITLTGNGDPSTMVTYTVRLESSAEEPTAPATVTAPPTVPATATAPPTDPPIATSTATSTPTASATATSPPQTGSVEVTYLYEAEGGGAPRPLAGGQFALKGPSCSTIRYGPVTTDAAGEAMFTNVALGNYCVSMVEPAAGFFKSDNQQVSVTGSSPHSVTVQAMPDPNNLPTPSPTATRPLPATVTPTSDLSAPPATATATATARATATATQAAGNENPTITPTVASRVEPPPTASGAPRQRAPRGVTPAPTSPSTAPSATATPPANTAPPDSVAGRIRLPRPTADAAPNVPTLTATYTPTQPTATPTMSPTETATHVASQPPVVRPPRTRSDTSGTSPATTTPSPSQGAQPNPTVGPSPTEPASSPRVRAPRLSSPAPTTPPTIPPTTPPQNSATLRAAVWICEDETRPDTVDFDPVPDIHVPVRDGCRPASGGEVTLRLRTTFGGATAFDKSTPVDAQGEVLFSFSAFDEGRMVELSVAEPPMPTTMSARLYPGDSEAVRITIYVAPDLAIFAGPVTAQGSHNQQPLVALSSASLTLSTMPVVGATLSLIVGRLRCRLNSRGPLPLGSVE